ncbi:MULTISPECIES: cupin domain-containing protein [Microbacterium]|uniref:cupin domain-containing protein n=1 Tax=Microbacterium TaxID=33882 RepID=UPI00277E0BEB|nr:MULTISPECIES: cupin domain-containing protein [Microbacterium]MDQ1075183.1 putative cupin superfamily protein [Microbacterium sp. SORGH_AS_0969]MDQ1115413.1 putative cupin superfamily protein [Microbacterium testaceum]
MSGGVVWTDASVRVPHAALPVGDVVAGAPTSGSVEIGRFGAVRFGVWEITRGVVADVEVDEVFVVLAGRGRVEFLAPAAPTIELAEGMVVRLFAGARTRWIVDETIRKVYAV